MAKDKPAKNRLERRGNHSALEIEKGGKSVVHNHDLEEGNPVAEKATFQEAVDEAERRSQG